MKRFLVLFLTCAMLLGICACTGKKSFEVPDEYNEDGRLIINVYGHDMDPLISPSQDTADILEIVENKFNIDLKIETTTVANSPTLLNQLIGGGDVPDMFIHFKDEPAYSNWIDSAYLMDYEPYLNDYPYLKNAFTALGTQEEVKSFLKGKLYSYPIIVHNNAESGALTTEIAMFYRRDWYQALVNKNWTPSSGRPLKDPEDPDFNYLNFYDLLEGFTEGDPDGNGQKDTYGYSLCKDEGVFWWYPVLNMFNAFHQGWAPDGNGGWVPEDISDNMHDAVMFMADMYDRGFINSDYNTTATFDAAKNNFVNGKAGVVVSNCTATMGSGVVDSMEGFLGKVANSKTMSDIVRGMPVVTGRDGVKRVLGAVNNYGYMAINNDISENKKRVILDLLNYILSPEGDTLLTWGIEGRHYEVGADGVKKSLLPLDQKGRQKTLVDNTVAWGVYRLKGLASWETVFTNDPRPQPEVTDQLMTAWDPKYMIRDELTFVSVNSSFATVQAELEDKTAIAFKQIVTKISGSAEEKAATREKIWDDFVKYYELKGSNYVAAMNASAKELYPDGKV